MTPDDETPLACSNKNRKKMRNDRKTRKHKNADTHIKRQHSERPTVSAAGFAETGAGPDFYFLKESTTCHDTNGFSPSQRAAKWQFQVGQSHIESNHAQRYSGHEPCLTDLSVAMTAVQQFEKDEQFMRLVRRDPDVNLFVAALEIARDGQPDLSFDKPLQQLKQAVAELTRPIALAGDEVNELKLLIEYLTGTLNLHGHYDSFESAESSYLNRVLETGRGIPISLSVIYMAVANELGIPLTGISAPSHFITQLRTDHTVLYVDPFRNGHIMEEAECVRWLHELTELPPADIRPSLKPATERQIMIRMLHNLKAHFGGRDQWLSAWKVQQRLALLNPGSYREKRDLAILSLRAGRPGAAVDQLEQCLLVCAPEERELLRQHLKDAHKALPALN